MADLNNKDIPVGNSDNNNNNENDINCVYNIKDFVKWLCYAAVNEIYYKPHQEGFLYRRDMGALLMLYIKEGWTEESISGFMENLRSVPLYSNGPKIFRTFIYVACFTPEEESRFESFLKAEQDKNAKAMLLTEFVIYNFTSKAFIRVGGGKIQDKALRKLLESSRREAGMSVSQRQMSARRQRGKYNDVAAQMQIINRKNRFFNPLVLLIIINVTVYLLDVFLKYRLGYKPFEYFGIQDNSLVRSGEWWRIITSMFLHADASHILGNMLMLIYLSGILMKFYTNFEYITIYMVSGIVGNMFSLMLMGDAARSLGASGAIMGLGGVLIYRMFFGSSAKAFRRAGSYIIIAFMVFYNLAYGLFVEGIDNYAHFFGFASGFIIAFIIGRLRIKKNIEQTPA